MAVYDVPVFHANALGGAQPEVARAIEKLEAYHQPTDNITALSGGAQPGTLLTTGMNRVVTIAAGSDSVSLPASAPGMEITVINAHASNAVAVFALGTTDIINALSNATAFSVAATKTCVFRCAVAGKWNTMVGA